MITAIDSRGVHRICEVFDQAIRQLSADRAPRTYLQNESQAALRLVTQAAGPVHRGSVALVETLIQRAQEQDGTGRGQSIVPGACRNSFVLVESVRRPLSALC
ncbi:QsdR family transcriptional regulator [Nocardia sp. NPDC056952]|uniref:QsdR family transcriptional regulator n=1 Tax=Nocardia sp. NPDC056952 TaxID=3345979 RepID=UPI0036365F03